jgi:hypothetical protein
VVWLSWSSGSLLTMVGRLEGAMPGAGGLAGLLMMMEGLTASMAAGCCWGCSCGGAAAGGGVVAGALAAGSIAPAAQPTLGAALLALLVMAGRTGSLSCGKPEGAGLRAGRRRCDQGRDQHLGAR